MRGALEQQEDAEGVAEEFGRLIVLTGFLEVSFCNISPLTRREGNLLIHYRTTSLRSLRASDEMVSLD